MKQRFINGPVFALALLLPAAATAGIVSPASYSYTLFVSQTPDGESSYTDPSLSKLTDGLTGTGANPGDGTWVGWQTSDSGYASITFEFASSVTITNIAFDFMRSASANTQTPTQIIIGGAACGGGCTGYGIPTDSLADGTQGFVSVAGSWTGSNLEVILSHSTNNWILVNEVQFSSEDAGAVPEPASFSLAGLALSGLAFAGKRKLRKRV